MKILVLLGALALAGCASKPVPPDWQADAKGALDGFTDDYLKGNTAAAEAEFRQARLATTATGRADHVAQVELVRCAAQAASLVFEDCPGYATLAADATATQRAYADYLAGRWQGLDPELLPEQHRPVLAGGPIGAVADPLARLVAAGAAFKAGRITPEGIAQAVETASNQGWRRPLLTWLGIQAQRADAAGDAAAATQIRRRIALAAGQR
ncbi:hypothetical protein B0920_03805 [Massilia sp. KIM]|uniref:hypothetical protein n=1 Tax=Massilia sp. KIM TaxID=1955422 RepID=UPI00098F1C3D|nr:hypothetical protein [Massilia sp. KIM]OON62580.1 hypothetical protein B0920_03805 [Massilia sp. KIM]